MEIRPRQDRDALSPIPPLISGAIEKFLWTDPPATAGCNPAEQRSRNGGLNAGRPRAHFAREGVPASAFGVHDMIGNVWAGLLGV